MAGRRRRKPRAPQSKRHERLLATDRAWLDDRSKRAERGPREPRRRAAALSIAALVLTAHHEPGDTPHDRAYIAVIVVEVVIVLAALRWSARVFQ